MGGRVESWKCMHKIKKMPSWTTTIRVQLLMIEKFLLVKQNWTNWWKQVVFSLSLLVKMFKCNFARIFCMKMLELNLHRLQRNNSPKLARKSFAVNVIRIFYRTQVRSYSTHVSDSLTNWLTNLLKIEWIDLNMQTMKTMQTTIFFKRGHIDHPYLQ